MNVLVSRDLNIQVPPESTGLILERLEADDLWSFVETKKCQVWIWLTLDATTRQVVAVHAGGRSEKDAQAFWAEVLEPYRSGRDVYTDKWDAYRGAIPDEVHIAVKKVRQDEPHRGRELHFTPEDQSLSEKNVSFSKSFVNHIGAIRYFLCAYNRWAYSRCLDSLGIIDCFVS